MSETGQDLEGSLKCYMKMYDKVFRENHDLRAQLAEARKEIERLKEQNDKFMWQVRDTCQRAEKAEAENAALRARLNRIEEVYKKYKPFFNVNSAVCDCEEELWQAIKAACE